MLQGHRNPKRERGRTLHKETNSGALYARPRSRFGLRRHRASFLRVIHFDRVFRELLESGGISCGN